MSDGLPNTCKACPNCPYGGPKVGSRGNPAAPMVWVAEAPGVEERRSGIPLTGPSGKLFWDALPKQLAEWGIDIERDILILNSMQCVPAKHNNQTQNEANKARGAHACHSRLMAEITAHPRKLIVAMGNHALRSITGNSGFKITQCRGMLQPSPYATVGLLPAVHPAALLHGTGSYRQFKRDVDYAIDLFLGAPPRAPVQTSYIVHDQPLDIHRTIKELAQSDYLACDTETSGLRPRYHRIASLGVASTPELIHIFPGKVAPLLRRLFMARKPRFIWHNGKFDVSFWRGSKDPDYRPVIIPEARVDEDTMLLSYALDENRGIHDLEQVSADLIGAQDYKAVMKPWIHTKNPHEENKIFRCPIDVHYNYLALDVSNTLQDFDILRTQVAEDPNLEKLYTRVLIPASETLAWVEARGITVCRNRLESNRKRLGDLVKDAALRIDAVARRYANTSVNPNSPMQLASILYDRLGLKPPPRAGRSTAADVLEKLPPHPFVRAIQDYRVAAKALSTYVDGFDKHIQDDGRVHATYLIHGTRTGRLSSRNPNMQNIPRDKHLRGQFEAGPGRRFLKVDLNQAELRSLAHFSRDPFLCKVYNDPNGASLHNEVAADMFGENFTGEDKMIAKNINFGIVYGITPPGLAEQLPEGRKHEAAEYIDRWFQRCPGAKEFIDYCMNAPAKGMTLITPFGRKKRHWVVTYENLKMLQNEASNFPHQSSASDVTLVSASILAPMLRSMDVWIENLIHDEILTSAPDDPEVIAKASALICSVMEQVPRDWGMTRVPFKAEADVGRRWGLYRKPYKKPKKPTYDEPLPEWCMQ